jgi:hypothetical protein
VSDERKCFWCKGSMTKAAHNAKHCSPKCRTEYQAERKRQKRGHNPHTMQGPFPPATCPVCGVRFEQRDRRQKYCKRKGSCALKFWRNTEAGRAYFNNPEVKEKRRQAAKRYHNSEHGKRAQKERDARPNNKARRLEYARSEQGKQMRTMSQRRRNAARAIAAILLPIHNLPEVNK